MKPPDINVPSRILQTNEENCKVLSKLTRKIFYLPGHSEVSKTGSLLRERPGAFPFDMEDKVLIQRFKAFFS
jgi:hypothetical protein